jgi:hypothetical protein
MLKRTVIEVFRGDDRTFDMHITDADGVDVNLTGCNMYFTVKTVPTDLDAAALIKVDWNVHTDPENGLTSFDITHHETDLAEGEYYFDIQMMDTTYHISTLVYGTFIITTDITTRAS